MTRIDLVEKELPDYLLPATVPALRASPVEHRRHFLSIPVRAEVGGVVRVLTAGHRDADTVPMKQRLKVPCIPGQEATVSVLLKEILLVGTKGRRRHMALFDGGASYSIIRRDVAASHLRRQDPAVVPHRAGLRKRRDPLSKDCRAPANLIPAQRIGRWPRCGGILEHSPGPSRKRMNLEWPIFPRFRDSCGFARISRAGRKAGSTDYGFARGRSREPHEMYISCGSATSLRGWRGGALTTLDKFGMCVARRDAPA